MEKEKLITSDMLLQFVSDPGVRWKEFQIPGAQVVELRIPINQEVAPTWILFFRKEKDAGRKVSAILKDIETNEAPKSDLAKAILASVDRTRKITGKVFYAKAGLRTRSLAAIIGNGYDLARDVSGFDLIYAFLMTSEGRAEPKDKVLKYFDHLITRKLAPEAASW